MKDNNGKEAFVSVNGVNYVSVAHVASSSLTRWHSTDHTGTHSTGTVSGRAKNGSWELHSDGTMMFEVPCGPYSYTLDFPTVKAYTKDEPESVTYEVKVKGSHDPEALEVILRAIADTKLSKQILSPVEAYAAQLLPIVSQGVSEARISEVVRETLKKEQMPGGALWGMRLAEGTSNIDAELPGGWRVKVEGGRFTLVDKHGITRCSAYD